MNNDLLNALAILKVNKLTSSINFDNIIKELAEKKI